MVLAAKGPKVEFDLDLTANAPMVSQHLDQMANVPKEFACDLMARVPTFANLGAFENDW